MEKISHEVQMKRWLKYKQFLHTGDWHVHTNYTDGKNTILEYAQKAVENNLELIAFTEHVRRIMDYSFEDFMSEVYSVKDKFNIEILVGCEAKVIDTDGNIDVSPDVLKKCDIVLGTFHEFKPKNKAAYLLALKNMLKNRDVDIWAHPTLFAKKNNFLLSDEEICELVELCYTNEVLIERNKKHDVPNITFLNFSSIRGLNFVFGSDAHQIDELLDRKTLLNF